MPPNTNTNVKTDQFSQFVERLGSANNVLITVSDNPSVDQLAACIGLTLALNKQGKHATAVFSGKVPSTLEFLQPEKTIETNTNSLRDFIISLDKAKADKLRYKVEDEYVKIFITPYRTSINEKDLDFSQGDFNIDLIITLGVHERAHLDGAIVAHGRILHDATVASLNTDKASEVGTLDWIDTDASSLCEMVSDLVSEVDKNLFDSQIATALLTGMVAETNRFGNEKARPHTMSVSGVLMAAGASTQLIANKLQEAEPEPEYEPDEEPEAEEANGEIPEVVEGGEDQPEEDPVEDDGAIHIDHDQELEAKKASDNIHIDEQGKLQAIKELEAARAEMEEEARKAAEPEQNDQKSLVLDPPQLSGQLTANTIAEHEQVEPSADALGVPSEAPLLDRVEPQKIEEAPQEPETPNDDQTLTEIEQSVNSIHINDTPADNGDQAATVPPPPPVDDARQAVEQAADAADNESLDSVGSTALDLNLGHDDTETPLSPPEEKPADDPKPKDSGNTPPQVPPPFMPPGV